MITETLLPHYKNKCIGEDATQSVVNARTLPVVNAVDQEDVRNPVLSSIIDELTHARNAYGENHLTVAEAYNSLGLIRLHMQHDANAAMKCHEIALRIFSAHERDSDIAITFTDLGYCHERLGQYQEALTLYKQAFNLWGKMGLDDDHPRVQFTTRALDRVNRT